MRRALHWLFQNTLLALTMTVVAAGAAGLYVAREVDASAYANVTRIYSGARPALRAQIHQEFIDGKISHWDYTRIWRQALEDAGGVMVFMPSKATVSAERDNLDRVLRKGLQHE